MDRKTELFFVETVLELDAAMKFTQRVAFEACEDVDVQIAVAEMQEKIWALRRQIAEKWRRTIREEQIAKTDRKSESQAIKRMQGDRK